jgi:hypothetical protein
MKHWLAPMKTTIEQMEQALRQFQKTQAMSLSEAGNFLTLIQEFHQYADAARACNEMIGLEDNYLIVMGSRLCDKLHQLVLTRLKNAETRTAPPSSRRMLYDRSVSCHPHPELLHYEEEYVHMLQSAANNEPMVRSGKTNIRTLAVS